MREAVGRIRHKLGTTKTGKALDKAFTLFNEPQLSGSRLGKENVGQVAIVVSDGHSHDNPIPAAERLRKLGEKNRLGIIYTSFFGTIFLMHFVTFFCNKYFKNYLISFLILFQA